MKNKAYPPNITFGNELRRVLERESSLRARLIEAGVHDRNIEGIVAATVPENILMVHLSVIQKIAGLNGRELFYREAKRRLKEAGEWDHDQLNDLATYAAFLNELHRQADNRGIRETAHILGMVEARHLVKWFDGSTSPSTDRLMKAIRFICSMRGGVVPSAPGPCEEVRALVAARQGKKQSPYSSPAIAKRLGNNEQTVFEWLSGCRPLPERWKPKIRRVFSELFGQTLIRSEPSVETRSKGQGFEPRVPNSAIAVSDGSVLGAGEHLRRRVIGAGLTALRSTLDMLNVAVCPQDFLDGDRAQILGIIRKAAVVAGIDAAAMERLDRIEPLDPKDPIFHALGGLFTDDRSTKRLRRKGK